MQTLPKLKAAQVIQKILAYQDDDCWLCVGEIGTQARGMGFWVGASDVSIARRLFELQKKGIVQSRFRDDCNYREWALRGNNNGMA